MPDAIQRVLGLITIGQSPRDDMMPQMLPFLPAGLTIRQAGALDDLSHDQVARLAPASGDYVLHTRMRDGTAVTVGRSGITPLLQGCLKRLEGEGANPIVLLCTGEFPELHSDALLIEPDRLLLSVVQGLRPRRPAVLVPLPSQIEAAGHKWRAIGLSPAFQAASPYGDPAEVQRAAAALRDHSPDLVIMDCMGYTQAHKRLVVQATSSLVILASSVVARVVGELVSEGPATSPTPDSLLRSWGSPH